MKQKFSPFRIVDFRILLHFLPGSIPSVFGESAGANMVTYRITMLLPDEQINKLD